MKTKITLTVFFLFLFLGIQAQTPSINETKSKEYYTTKRFYTSPTLIKSKKRALKKDKDTKEIKNKIRNLRIDPSYKDYEKLYDSIINKNQNSLDSLLNIKKQTIKDLHSRQELITNLRREIDSLNIEKEAELASLDKFQWMLPTWKKANRKKFFQDMYNNDTDKTNFLNSFALNSNNDATSVQTELVTDNMWALRISFGSVLSVSSSKTDSESTPEEVQELNKNETEQEAFSRLINGGGNFYLETILPLFTTNQNNGDQITSYTYANLKGAMDIEKFNSNIDTSTGNASLGLISYLGISSDSKKFNFFVIGNMNYTIGSKDFYKNLGLYKEIAFLNGKIIAGISILNKFKLLATINTFGSDEKLRSGKVNVGIQILP